MSTEIEILEILATEFSESISASSQELYVMWKHFRMTDPTSLAIYGKLSELTIDANLPILHPILHPWFLSFIQQSAYKTLQIETAKGGISIRKTLPGESIHKFVTTDLPPDESHVIAQATFLGY